MNWLDIVIIVILLGSVFQSMRMGLIGAAITALGIIIGWQLAGQFSDDLGALFDDSLSSDTWVTVISYVIIMGLSIVVAGIVAKIVRPILSIGTLGLSSMVDRLGGVALGLVVGVILSGTLIVAMARFAYNFDIPEEGIAGAVAQRVPDPEGTRQSVEDALVGSGIVSAFVNVADALPGDTFGFIPSDFKASLDILEEQIDQDNDS